MQPAFTSARITGLGTTASPFIIWGRDPATLSVAMVKGMERICRLAAHIARRKVVAIRPVSHEDEDAELGFTDAHTGETVVEEHPYIMVYMGHGSVEAGFHYDAEGRIFYHSRSNARETGIPERLVTPTRAPNPELFFLDEAEYLPEVVDHWAREEAAAKQSAGTGAAST